MAIFINHTNHPLARWSAAQRAAAEEYGEIVDLPFPDIAPEWDEAAVARLADEQAERILMQSPAAVLCQGEFTYSYALIRRLVAAGIPVLAACSRRESYETPDVAGHTTRTSVFAFVRFRRYV